MRDKNGVLFLAILLLFLSFFFLQVESFVNYDSQDSHIVLTDYGPVDSVQIRYDWERDHKDRSGDQNHTPINITEVVIYDKSKRRIPYWNHRVWKPSTCVGWWWWAALLSEAREACMPQQAPCCFRAARECLCSQNWGVVCVACSDARRHSRLPRAPPHATCARARAAPPCCRRAPWRPPPCGPP